ncbi:9250_t:CDS:2, partial [Gigaspora margarita]
EVLEHFAGRLNEIDDGCVRDTKKIKITYANNQNKETKRAESGLTLTSDNARARDQEITSEVMDNDLNTTTNTDLENQRAPIQVLDDNNSHTVDPQTKAWKNIEESQQIDHMQTYGYTDHNSGTIDIEIKDHDLKGYLVHRPTLKTERKEESIEKEIL